MKPFFLLLFLVATQLTAQAQTAKPAVSAAPEPDKAKQTLLVEASCGQCRLGLPGKGCDLAVRLADGKAYFVDGTTIDSHGDAHAKDGFCQAIRQAQVQGAVVDGRFKATYFQLLPEAAKSK
ncbi:hypothetical protein E5K00_00395 [Hymenobacter aquaticus]|uniref:Glutaminyl-tRNA synthetase n=1 Tax=Hymenobacter aquaticus TaxID=1867101 RepID=A0A4Z0Q2I0_9BACT|nr:DUF6370 family protein [Hymenobacter aquaticus]TGE23706.1 hypothetical protein E5K00_00395 [Hymenobacter aquaticus]